MYRQHPSPVGSARPVRRRRRGRLLSLIIVLLFGGYLAWSCLVVPRHALAGSINTATPRLAGASLRLNWPATGQASLGAVGYGVLTEHNTAKPLPTASVAKLITALCVLQKHPLTDDQSGPTITMTQADVDSYHYYLANHGSLIAVRAGQQMTERQALEAMLLRSANNMADSVARWSFGSLPDYANFANSFVAQHGMAHTHVGGDASGFDPSTTSTASDLVRLGELVMQQPVLSQIVSQKSAVIPEDGTVHNTNNLLGQHGIVGIKTGNNDQDPGAFLLAAKYQADGHQITIVDAVMGATSLGAAKQAAVNLLLSARSHFTTRTVVAKGASVGSYVTAWANPVKLVADQDLTVFGWSGSDVKTTVHINPSKGAASPDHPVGSVSIAGGANVPISLARRVPAPSLRWRLTHPLQ